VKQLQTDIDTLREFSELERSFMESQVFEERNRSEELENTVQNLKVKKKN
jgi:hypothetical protein